MYLFIYGCAESSATCVWFSLCLWGVEALSMAVGASCSLGRLLVSQSTGSQAGWELAVAAPGPAVGVHRLSCSITVWIFRQGLVLCLLYCKADSLLTDPPGKPVNTEI